MNPYLELFDGSSKRLIYTGPTEAFFTYIRTSLTSAIIISFPFWIGQIYLFLAPALYKKEKKLILPLFILSPTLFALGALLSYCYILPLAIKFFSGFEYFNPSKNINLAIEMRISEYLSFAKSLLLGFGLAAQLPLLLITMIHLKLVSMSQLKKKRKYVIIAIFLISAILTPPDVISQLILAIIMIVIFETIILFGQKNNQ